MAPRTPKNLYNTMKPSNLDNLHHNYLHLNVNSPKHHTTTLGTNQGWAGHSRAPFLPALDSTRASAWGRAGGRPCEPVLIA